MSILKTPDEADATGTVAQIYADDRRSQGFVSEHTRLMALNPEAFVAWDTVTAAISAQLGLRRYELVTLAAALGVRSTHCRLAHGQKALEVFSEDQLVHIASDYRSAGLPDAEVAMMEFAEKVSTDATSMTDADSIRLRDLGFGDAEIANIAMAAAARNYYSKALQALGAAVDETPEMSNELRAALVPWLSEPTGEPSQPKPADRG